MKQSSNSGGNNRVYKTIFWADTHAPLVDEDAFNAFLNFVKDYQPDEVIHLGDLGEWESVSHWIEDKRRKIEGKRLSLDFEACNNILDRLDAVLPKNKKVKKVLCLGNHEDWIEQYLDCHPEMEHLVDMRETLRLRERGYEVFELNDYYRNGKMVCVHGPYENMFHSKTNAEKVGTNVVYGHVHTHQVCTLRNLDSPYKGVAVPCLCKLNKDFLKNRLTNWVHGFAISETLPNGNFNMYVIEILNGIFSFNGKIYDGKSHINKK